MKYEDWMRWVFPKRMVWHIKQTQRKFLDNLFNWWRM